jgi:arginine decarboxylase
LLVRGGRAAHRMNHTAYIDFVHALENIARYDQSESNPALGSLFRFDPGTPLGRDQQGLADAYNAAFAYPGTNGTTPLNALALLAICQPGDTIVLQRDSHLSLFAAIYMLGLHPVYVLPEHSCELGISLGVSPSHLAKVLDAHPEAKGVCLTYPNYFGVASDLGGCAQVAHERNTALVVDSAHGSHFPFHPDFPTAASAVGAAIVTHSLHKTCSALEQGSLALFADETSWRQFYKAVNSFGYVSTSPSYLLLQALFLSVRQLVLQGENLLDQAIAESERVRNALNRMDGLFCFGGAHVQAQGDALGFDPLRVTVDVTASGLTGYQVVQFLIEQFALYPELATARQVLFLFTLADSGEKGQRIIDAFEQLACSTFPLHRPATRSRSAHAFAHLPRQLLPPRDALFARRRARLAVEAAIGFPSAETISVFPPGYPVLVAGEEVTQEVVSMIRETCALGGFLKGADNPAFTTMWVVEEP